MCAEIAQPLSHLTRKDSNWIRGNKERSAHQKLLEALYTAPVLKHFEPDKQTYLSTDASDFSIGGWISQYDDQEKIRPILYYSRKMNDHERKYPVHEKELLAIITMLDHHGLFLTSGTTCRTDH